MSNFQDCTILDQTYNNKNFNSFMNEDYIE